MRYPKTLRVRFALWTAGLLLAALALFGFFVYASMARSLAAIVDETLQATALELGAEVELQEGEPVFTENPLEDPQYTRLWEQGVSFRLLDVTGRTVQEHGPYRDLPPPPPGFAVLGQPALFATVTDSATQDPVRVYTLPVAHEGQVVGILQVGQNLKAVRQTLNSLLVTLLIAGPLIIALAASGGYFLAARALAPIDAMTRTARDLSADDLSARLNLPYTEDEVGRLAATFDSMLDRLDQAFRRERQFTAHASHELRTPLSAMQVIISGTLARQRDATEYQQALIDLRQETQRMRVLTENLLQLARHDAARPAATGEQVDLALLLHDVADSVRPVAAEKGLQLMNQAPPEGLTLIGDRDGLVRLFVNLLTNAIKYTEQGTITVSAAAGDDGGLVVTIRDTGVGIPAAHLPHIFDPFYRGDESRSTEGMGLGLSIAQAVARAHGGDIAVASQVGKGTTFVVRLGAG